MKPGSPAGRLILAACISVALAALLYLLFPASRAAIWAIIPGIFVALLLYSRLTKVETVRRGQQLPETEDPAPITQFSPLLQDIQSVLTVDKLFETLDTYFAGKLPGWQGKYFLSMEFFTNDSPSAGLVAWGDAEPWMAGRLWQIFTVTQAIQSRPVADARLQEIFTRSGTDIALPIIHRQHLLGVIMLGGSTQKNGDELKQKVIDFLVSHLPVVLDRIRVYRGVWLSKEQDHSERLLAKRSLSANIAHEMRTPLSGIRASLSGIENYLPLLLDAYDEARRHNPAFPEIRPQHLENLRTTPARTSLMIDQANAVIDLLLMNLRESGGAPLSRCQAADCIERAVERYPFKTGEKERVKLLPGEGFEFMGVEVLFIYVMFNLLKNSLYAIGSAGKGEITISLRPGAEMNTIIVEDTGTGIPLEVQQKIFDSFFTTREEGTGAGLTFCKRTLQQFGGDISCESVPGQFTRFTLQLPPA